MKPSIIITAVIVAVIGITIGLVAYSYTQIQVNLNEISFAGLDWAPISGNMLLKLAYNALTGNILSLASSLITGIKVNLIFVLSNHGVFPVYIPDLSYDLSINGVKLGQGQSNVDTTINPGETKDLPILQHFQINSLEPVAGSIVNTGGIMNLQVNGTAYFKFLGLSVPVPFQSTKQISLMDEVKKHINNPAS